MGEVGKSASSRRPSLLLRPLDAVTKVRVEVQPPVGEEVRSSGEHGVAVDDTLHAQALHARERVDRGEIADAGSSRANSRARTSEKVNVPVGWSS